MTVKRILFIAEAVTLAHLTRLLVFVDSLKNNKKYELHIACDERYKSYLESSPAKFHPIHSISSEKFLHNLERGAPLFDEATLKSYVEEDIKLMEEIKPDIVIGDLRLSLSISARLLKIRYMTICNAHWSPYTKIKFQIISHPLIKMIGRKPMEWIFKLIKPFAFALHTLPLNRTRRHYGLPTISYDLREIYTSGDYVAYVDIPEMAPTTSLPNHHRFLGPVIWSPPTDPPDWWDNVPNDKPTVYLSLGSSGDKKLLNPILKKLAKLPIYVLFSTAGRFPTQELPENVYGAPYLPGIEAAKRAKLVICNGGCGATKQALAAGVPVLGVIANMDQWLVMQGITHLNAGEILFESDIYQDKLDSLLQQILFEQRFKEGAKEAEKLMHQYDTTRNFNLWLDEILK